jgi:CHAT domain-containing protein/tetratricopeptide (TPR) repeat protein
MRWYFILFLVFFTTSLTAQNPQKLQESAISYINKGNFEAALVSLNQLAKLYPDNEWILSQRCNAFGQLNKFPEAISDAKRLLNLNPDNNIYQNNMGWYLMLNGQYEDAAGYCKKAIEIRPEDFNGYLNLAHIYAFLKDRRKAVYYYQYAAEYLPDENAFNSVLGDFNFLSAKPGFISDTSFFTGLFRNSFLQKFLNKRANEILDSVYLLKPGDPRVSEMKNRFISEEEKNINRRYRVLSDFTWQVGKAEFLIKNSEKAFVDHFTNAILLSEKINDTPAVIGRYLELAGLLGEEKGINYLYKALSLADTFDEPDIKEHIYISMSDSYEKKSGYDSGIKYSRLAWNLALSSKKDKWKYKAATHLQFNFSAMHQMDSSIYYYNVAKNYLENSDEKIEEKYNTDYSYLLSLYKNKFLEQCIKEIPVLIGKYSPFRRQLDLSAVYELAGIASFDLGNFKMSETYLWLSIREYKKYLDDNKGRSGLALLNIEKESSLEYLARIYNSRKDVSKLFEVSELKKANIYYVTLINSPVPPKNLSLLTTQRKLKDDEAVITYSGSGHVDYGYGIGFSKTRSILMQESLQKTERAFQNEGIQHFKSMYAPLASLIALKSGDTSGAEINTALLSLLSYFQNNYTGNIKGNSRGATDLGDTLSTGERSITLKTMNEILYDMYIAPFESILKGKKTLYISPDVSTNLISFEALQNKKGEYLGALYNIIYIPSSTVASLIKQKPANNNNSMLAVGNPLYREFKATEMNGRAYDLAHMGYKNWGDLPGTGAELGNIKKIIPGAVLIQKNEVNESVLQELNNSGKLRTYNYLHFALHGMNMLDNFADHSIIVTEKPGSVNDGFLQFGEITHLQINAKLVCLSACETGMVGYAPGNELNLASAFILAGARSVVASSWLIDDEATVLFMTDFYKNIFNKNQTVAEALHSTRVKFIEGKFGEEYRSPSYWAAFKFLGN